MVRLLRRLVFWFFFAFGALVGVHLSHGEGVVAMAVTITFCAGHAAVIGYGLSNIRVRSPSKRRRGSSEDDEEDEDEQWHEDRHRATHRGFRDDDETYGDSHHVDEDDWDRRW